jgi:hypothetical protein
MIAAIPAVRDFRCFVETHATAAVGFWGAGGREARMRRLDFGRERRVRNASAFSDSIEGGADTWRKRRR